MSVKLIFYGIIAIVAGVIVMFGRAVDEPLVHDGLWRGPAIILVGVVLIVMGIRFMHREGW